MLAWLSANAANLVIGGILLIGVIFAVRYMVKKTKQGGCIGCDCGGEQGCGSSCNCSAEDKR